MAKKRRNKKRKPGARGSPSPSKMARRLGRLSGVEDMLLAPPNEEKMSEVLLDFASPLLEVVDDDRQFERAISMAVVCWNVALLPQEAQETAINKMIEVIAPTGSGDMATARDVVQFLLERKKRDFPDNRRFIVDYQISHSKEQRHVLVASTLQQPGT